MLEVHIPSVGPEAEAPRQNPEKGHMVSMGTGWEGVRGPPYFPAPSVKGTPRPGPGLTRTRLPAHACQVFRVEVRCCGRRHTVLRRYSEFHVLHKRVRRRRGPTDRPGPAPAQPQETSRRAAAPASAIPLHPSPWKVFRSWALTSLWFQTVLSLPLRSWAIHRRLLGLGEFSLPCPNHHLPESVPG